MVDNIILDTAAKDRAHTLKRMADNEGVPVSQDPALDFRAFGKSVRCNIDHSKYQCVLPYTSTKQHDMRLHYVKLCQEEDSRSFEQEILKDTRIKSVRPLRQEAAA